MRRREADRGGLVDALRLAEPEARDEGARRGGRVLPVGVLAAKEDALAAASTRRRRRATHHGTIHERLS